MTAAPSTTLPPLAGDFAGDVLTAESELTRWAGASGPFWHPPRAVLLPRNASSVAAAVRWAREHGLSLVPRGGGSGMPAGNVGPYVTLDLSRLEHISADPVPTDAGSGGPGTVAATHDSPTLAEGPLRIRAGAGTTGAAMRELALNQGADMPALPSSAPWCTAGGMASCNAAGARSFSLGAVRSWVRAIEWVRADGSVETLERGRVPSPFWSRLRDSLRADLPTQLPWPRVRKNSSGYALDHFLATGDPVDLAIGSEGTLGVITAVTFQTHVPPDERAVLLIGVPTLAELGPMAAASHHIPTAAACEYFGSRLLAMGGLSEDPRLEGMRFGGGLILLELAGTPEQVAEGLAQATAMAYRAGGAVTARDEEGMAALWHFRHGASPTIGRALAQGRRSTQFIEDCVVPVHDLHRFVAGLDEILAGAETEAAVFGHAGDGNLHVNPLVDLNRPDWRDRVRGILHETVDLVSDLGGTMAGEHGDGRLRTPFLPRFFTDDVIRAFERVKTTLDPTNALNPGVIVPEGGEVDPLAGLGDAPDFASGSQGPERRQR